MRNRRWPALKSLLMQLHARRRLLIAVGSGVIVGLLLPGSLRGVTRGLVGWNVGVWLYLLMVWAVMVRARPRAAAPDRGGTGRKRQRGAGDRDRRDDREPGGDRRRAGRREGARPRAAMAASAARARHAGEFVAAAADRVRAELRRPLLQRRRRSRAWNFPAWRGRQEQRGAARLRRLPLLRADDRGDRADLGRRRHDARDAPARDRRIRCCRSPSTPRCWRWRSTSPRACSERRELGKPRPPPEGVKETRERPGVSLRSVFKTAIAARRASA